MNKLNLKNEAILMLVPMFWALTFPFIHVSVQSISPGAFVFWRFLLAAVLMLPFVFFKLTKINGYILGWSFVLGLLNGGTFIFQTVGLESVSSARAAFITGSSVIMVPILCFIAKLGKPSLLDFMFAIVCLIGLYVLTGANFSAITIGDLFIILCALTTSLSIILIQRVTPNISEIGLFTFLQIVFTLPCCFIQSHDLFNPAIVGNYFVIFSIVFCAVFATSVALVLQTKFQQYTTEFKAALIFTTEPVFATLFAYVFFAEPVNRFILIGGVIILGSLLLNLLSNSLVRPKVMAA